MPRRDYDEDDREDRNRRDRDDERDERDDDDDRDRRALSPRAKEFAGKKVTAGILGILLGGFGIHKFVLGFQSAGIIMLAVSIFGIMSLFAGLFCLPLALPVLGTMAMSLIGFIEGILYITKSDEDFYQAYAIDKKTWF